MARIPMILTTALPARVVRGSVRDSVGGSVRAGLRRVLPAVAMLVGASAGASGPSATPPAAACSVDSGARRVPVIELYTSEGCSSCPPADRWLSGLKGAQQRSGAVIQAFHVGYWDYIGWVDRFATPAHTQRQREIAQREKRRHVYTPQVVRNGQDWRDWDSALAAPGPARASLALRRVEPTRYEARVTPNDAQARWAAYWTVTEHGHASRVKAGENAGEHLRHDFVVRQYTPVGEYRGTRTLTLDTIAPDAAHARQVNLVVYDPASGEPLQAVSAACG